jgi:hypothetical protein
MSDERRESGDSGELRDDSQESGPIKVTDRRKFDSSGDLRESGGEPQEAAAVEREDPPSETTAPGPATAPSPDAAAPPPREKPAGGPAKGSAAPGQEPLDLRFFVYDLYMSALQMLGVPTQAGAPAGKPDLERARYFVEFLQVLEEKTKGNLAQGEERMLNDVLYDLRMKFVEISRKGPA